ncbi:SGNH/GDSL hydrolase family protein [Alicyclobacillus vulcanalis]|uniref:Acyl-CoA thioesterase-1 n=1 Tax=Alicyclobacillus vulcanalis TaxID=252246 RepID=A0A1N7N2Q6_9BACL|nr:SGNH/GDSL hydrolase family protein [Alicyclobacillus vulcanalis]SIS92657.1 acyl-CoA thioesterase-1 [Alicyclobacillus vulcanalis]
MPSIAGGRRFQVWLGACAVALALSACGAEPPQNAPTASAPEGAQSAARPSSPYPLFSAPPSQPVVAMGIGGSVAHGWDDKSGGGYLVRAFQQLTKAGPISFDFVNKSIEGYGPTQMAAKYPAFLREIHPQVVVISWGMLDDIANKTPIPAFEQAVQSEITQALSAHAYVVVVTPPPTGASYGHDVTSESQLVADEVRVAKKFKTPDVIVVDLFNQMKQYLAAHHQSIQMYSADDWHPNTLGHELAGSLLAADLRGILVPAASQGEGGKTSSG